MRGDEFAAFYILTHAGNRGAIEVEVPDDVRGEAARELGLGAEPGAQAVPVRSGERLRGTRDDDEAIVEVLSWASAR